MVCSLALTQAKNVHYVVLSLGQNFLYWRMVSEFGSPAFDEFLDCIGQRVSLQGFTGYRGGLDCKSKSRSTSFFNETRSFLFTLYMYRYWCLSVFIVSYAYMR